MDWCNDVVQSGASLYIEICGDFGCKTMILVVSLALSEHFVHLLRGQKKLYPLPLCNQLCLHDPLLHAVGPTGVQLEHGSNTTNASNLAMHPKSHVTIQS
eukprot:6487309-Amphidinium_carterae.1